ncbi:hypothetical protein H0O03_03195, partial [Candidatus Micrarchaeota archaeon]|nr:hypothetical protein [Candidatus Micrarchaeota archaeon]
IPDMGDKLIVTSVLTGVNSAQMLGKTEEPRRAQALNVGLDSISF